MDTNIQQLKVKFEEVMKIGWLEADTKNSGIFGITFEKLIGLTPNEFQIPDFDGIEIKTKSNSKFNYISLFNCTPTGPHYHEVEIIKDAFGYPDSTLKNFKVFNGDVFANKLNRIGNKFYFKLNVYDNKARITLSVYNNKKNKIEESTYWDFDILEEKVNRKLNYLALINVEKRKANNKIRFKYKKIRFYKLKNFKTFVDLIKSGVIKVCFNLSIYRDQNRLGKIHDRGTSFAIEEKNINMLFDLIE